MDFLCRNLEVFARSHEDMPGISPEVIVHVLNVDPDIKPVKQKKRKFALEIVEAVAEGRELTKSAIHQGSLLPQLVNKRGHCKEVQRKVENVRGLYRPQQSLSKRQLPPPTH